MNVPTRKRASRQNYKLLSSIPFMWPRFRESLPNSDNSVKKIPPRPAQVCGFQSIPEVVKINCHPDLVDTLGIQHW